MIESLFQAGISNACVAFLIAIAALAVGLLMKRPQLSHFLWLLVLIKLVTPPLFNLPVPQFSSPAKVAAVDRVEVETGMRILGVDPDLRAGELPLLLEGSGASSRNNESIQERLQSRFAIPSAFWNGGRPWLGLVWLAGTLFIFAWSLFQILRFQNLLNQNCSHAGKDLLQMANRIKNQLGLRTLPKISTTAARLSPMVWWLGGSIHVIMPQVIINEMKEDQWKWILAHELAHVRRRDYLVRWLEWLACACFWWNPVFWLAQRNLRAAEEICCDELVLTRLNASSFCYANSILTAVESLVVPEFRPPAMASEMNSGGFLKRRINMILNGGSKQSSLRSLQYLIAGMAMLLIPIGFVNAQDFDAIKKRLTKAVKHDEITLKQAAIMMEALRESRNFEHDHDNDEHRDSYDGDRHHEENHEREMHERENRERENRERENRERENRGREMHEREMHERENHDRGHHEWEMRERENHERNHERENHERENHERENHERENHERENHEREMHERARQQEIRNQEMRARDLERANQAQKKLAAELEMINERLKQEVRKKEMTLEEYELKMVALKQGMKNMEKRGRDARPGSKRPGDKNAMLRAKYEDAVEKLESGVRAGKLSKEDAKKRLDAFRNELWPEAKEKEEVNKKREFEAAEKEIKALIEAGRIKREDGMRRLEEMKTYFWGKRENASQKSREEVKRVDREEMQKDRGTAFQSAAKQLKAAVEAGKISKRQAEERLIEMRRRLKGDQDEDDEDDEDDDDDDDE